MSTRISTLSDLVNLQAGDKVVVKNSRDENTGETIRTITVLD